MQQLALINKIKEIQNKHQNLLKKLADYSYIGDKTYIELTKKISELAPIIEKIKEHDTAKAEIDKINLMLENEQDLEMQQIASEEKDLLEKRINTIVENIKELLLPKSQDDQKNAILEVRSGTGGEEASLFAYELFCMYQKYSAAMGWNFEILSVKDTETQGIREASALIKGKDVFANLKFESGVHRVQRVPITESSGRVHTSAATVAVLPEAQSHDLVLEDKDLQIETCRSSGAGGQHVNTTDSAVKITHIPTGFQIVQQGKSQHRNKANGLRILRAKILSAKQEEEASKRSQERKMQVGSGDRSEKIRTYNFPQDRITDHRIGLTLHDLEKTIKEGNINSIVQELQRHYKTKMLQEYGL